MNSVKFVVMLVLLSLPWISVLVHLLFLIDDWPQPPSINPSSGDNRLQ